MQSTLSSGVSSVEKEGDGLVVVVVAWLAPPQGLHAYVQLRLSNSLSLPPRHDDDGIKAMSCVMLWFFSHLLLGVLAHPTGTQDCKRLSKTKSPPPGTQ